MRLPGYVLENEFVTNFFMPLTHTRSALNKSNRGSDGAQSDSHSRNPRFRSLTIYNSQMADNSSGHRPECRQKVTHSSVSRKLSENGYVFELFIFIKFASLYVKNKIDKKYLQKSETQKIVYFSLYTKMA